MRCFALLALIFAATVGISSALVEAGDKTTVTVYANGYDTKNCGDGCSPEKTRDGSLDNDSRWSCKEDLVGENCEITYKFEEPQDIVDMKIAFYKGDERTRTLKVKLNGSTDQTIYSSGATSGFETFDLNSDETKTLTLESLGLDGDEWISILETEFWVEE